MSGKQFQYILPILILCAIVLEQAGVLHVGYLYIKSHELKWTDLDIGLHSRKGDIYTAGEHVTNNNYEDAIIAFYPDYNQPLKEDLVEISLNREHIDRIDGEHLSFYSGQYKIQACLDKKEILIKDSTLFKKLVNVEILGNYSQARQIIQRLNLVIHKGSNVYGHIDDPAYFHLYALTYLLYKGNFSIMLLY